MEEFCDEVREVTHEEDEERLDDADLAGEARREAREEAEEDAEEGRAARHDEKRGEAGEDVDDLDVGSANLAVRLEHVVEDLRGEAEGD